MLGLAVLTRETALLVAAGFGCAWLLEIIKKEEDVPPSRIWIFPLAVYLLWHGLLQFWVVHGSIGQAASEKIGWPLTGLIQSLWKNASTPTPDHLFYLFFIFATLVWQFFVAATARRRNDPLYFGLILYGVLLSVVGRDIWDNSPGLLRIAAEWNVLGFFTGCSLRSRSLEDHCRGLVKLLVSFRRRRMVPLLQVDEFLALSCRLFRNPSNKCITVKLFYALPLPRKGSTQAPRVPKPGAKF